MRRATADEIEARRAAGITEDMSLRDGEMFSEGVRL